MFRVSTLKKGNHYLFRGQLLTYQSNKKGYKGKVYKFQTPDGTPKEICRIILQTELWEEIENE